MAFRRSVGLLSLASTSSIASSSATTVFCKASTSTAHVTISQAKPSQQQYHPFHSSPVAHEKKRKQVARLRKKANLARRERAQQQLEATAPDTVRGFGPNNEGLWYDSELRKILLFPEEVYNGQAGLKGMLPELPGEKDDTRLGPKGITSDDLIHKPAMESKLNETRMTTENEPTSTSNELDSIPPYYNFAISPDTAKVIFQDVPEAEKLITTANNTSVMKEDTREHLDHAIEHKRQATSRILDLLNANARGIRFENTRRIIRRFGQGEGPGRVEVQAAILTMRIHSLADHLQNMPRDIHSKRHVTRLVMDRAKLLKYLKGYDLQRYVQCLQDIGVEQRAVEGSILVKL